MNKQQLASVIWEFCEEARTSSITTSEYKDVILGFIFYKFLSDNINTYLINREFSKQNIIDELNDKNYNLVKELKENKGYFIEYNNLFSTWMDNINDISYTNVNDAIVAFDRNISDDYRKVYKDIFKSLNAKLDSLGDDNNSKTRHIREIIKLINKIPTNNLNSNYDVLGYIYEFLLGKFNTIAEKGGEFYTPNEISIIMSDIASYHLKDKNSIKVYDPTSGSGSLLINIGESIKRHLGTKVNIEYYAQELVESTYNLTRMNLLMKGIKPANIYVRLGDTLEKDWPFLDDAIQVDCVIANPPYSQNWNPEDHKQDPRFEDYGLAPAKKRADYAFLLHCLFHMNNDGIMQIVLPHGVLFRGGAELEIRKNLVEKNNIETIINLPANIFSNTGIPTCILILKKNRNNENILFVDASEEFIKDGKINRLQGSNIRKIVDTIIDRKDVSYFSRVVSKKEIIDNEYNLNISKYISSKLPIVPYDLYATVYGGIPNKEIELFNDYWSQFSLLKKELFNKTNEHVSSLENKDINFIFDNSKEISEYKNDFINQFKPFKQYLLNKLIYNDVKNPYKLKEEIIDEIFKISSKIKLTNKYSVYNAFDKEWNTILNDIENINLFGRIIFKQTEEKEIKKSNKTKKYVDGKIFTFELIKNTLYYDELEKILELNNEINEIDLEILSLINDIDEEYKSDFYNSENESINQKELKKIAKDLSKTKYSEDSDEFKIILIAQKEDVKKNINKNLKSLNSDLNKKSLDKIEKLNEKEIEILLEQKWIKPIIDNINNIVYDIINEFISKINMLIDKYDNPIDEVDKKIKKEEKQLSLLLNELECKDEFNKKAIKEIIKLLGDK